jgi:hypothetical protein
MVIGLVLISVDLAYGVKKYDAGMLVNVVDEFDPNAVQEIHTAIVNIRGEKIRLNVLSDFSDTHHLNHIIIVKYKIGKLTGIKYNVKIDN